MKKLKNKNYQIFQTKKIFEQKQKRKGKKYSPLSSLNDSNNSFLSQPLVQKTLHTPKVFSFIYNLNESLDFFDKFSYHSKQVDSLLIDMKSTKEMTIEVLLYLISLDKINENQNIKINIKIKTPKEKHLRILMAQSGFSKYFKANANVRLNHEAIFTIKDGETNRKENRDDSLTCKDAVEFAMKRLKKEKKDIIMRKLYNSLAEMMLNTDNHAYDEDGELRNWYLFAIENDKGIAFYFFDNGKGITKTAKKTLLEKVGKSLNINLAQASIMKAVLEGDYRSATNKPNRNKGIPQINNFLKESAIELPIILTNKIYYLPQEIDISKSSIKASTNFRGTLFVWMLKKEQNV